MKFVKNFTKICELLKENEVIHFFENEFGERVRIITSNKDDFEKDKNYKIIIEKDE